MASLSIEMSEIEMSPALRRRRVVRRHMVRRRRWGDRLSRPAAATLLREVARRYGREALAAELAGDGMRARRLGWAAVRMEDEARKLMIGD